MLIDNFEVEDVSYRYDDGAAGALQFDDFDLFDSLFDESLVEHAVDDRNMRKLSYHNTQTTDKKKRKHCKSVTSKFVQKVAPVTQSLKWSSFPSFDKSDAMVYFPSTFARLRNSGDCKKVCELLRAYCTKSCRVEFMKAPHAWSVPVSIFLQLLVADDSIHPDGVMCMRSTKVVDNQIIAELYFKHVDVPEAHQYRGISASHVDKEYQWMVTGQQRTPMLIRNLRLDTRTELAKKQAIRLIESQADLELYGKLDLSFTFDPQTKKVTKITYLSHYTSIACGGVLHDL